MLRENHPDDGGNFRVVAVAALGMVAARDDLGDGDRRPNGEWPEQMTGQRWAAVGMMGIAGGGDSVQQPMSKW